MFRQLVSVPLVLVIGHLCGAQSAPPVRPSIFEARPPQILRATRIRGSGIHVTQTCVAIYANGRERIERTKLDTLNATSSSRVLERTLTSSEMNTLSGILDTEDLRSLHTSFNTLPGAAQDWEWWVLSVARKEGPQNLFFRSSDRTTSRPPKAFVDWFKNVDRQDGSELPNAAPDQCTLHLHKGDLPR
jgi:hypothetical protein